MVAGACAWRWARRQAATAGASFESQLQRHAAAGARVAIDQPRDSPRCDRPGTTATAASTESRSREICMRKIARDGPDHAALPGPIMRPSLEMMETRCPRGMQENVGGRVTESERRCKENAARRWIWAFLQASRHETKGVQGRCGRTRNGKASGGKHGARRWAGLFRRP